MGAAIPLSKEELLLEKIDEICYEAQQRCQPTGKYPHSPRVPVEVMKYFHAIRDLIEEHYEEIDHAL